MSQLASPQAQDASQEQCGICRMIDPRNDLVLYEDADFFAMQHPLPMVPGHIVLFPKRHLRIFEEVPADVVGRMFVLANSLSSVLFDTLQIQGTNILVQNGTSAGQLQPHVVVHVIPRRENDGINMMWDPQPASDDDLSVSSARIKPHIEYLTPAKPQAAPVVMVKEPQVEPAHIPEKDDYRLRQLRRIP